jgi:hypothetical protein
VDGPGWKDEIFNLSGATTATATTFNGSYTFSNLLNGTYTVTPKSRLNTYAPISITVTLTGTDAKNLDFKSYAGTGTTTGFSSIWFADATHGWGGYTRTSVQTWNGANWVPVDPMLIPGSSNELLSVHGTGINDVWAVGLDGLILHWNGSAWSAATPVGGVGLSAVWSRTANDAWIGGNTNILHWNGTTWSFAPVKDNLDTSTVNAIWGSSASDVWAFSANSKMMHWDGSLWTVLTNTIQRMTGMWGFAANDIWAVGDHGYIQHYDGTVWTAVTSPATENLHAVWGSASNDVWAGGDKGTLLHWNGSAWSSVDSTTDHDIASIHGSSANNVWIAGSQLLVKIQ